MVLFLTRCVKKVSVVLQRSSKSSLWLAWMLRKYSNMSESGSINGEEVLTRDDNGVLIISINRPHRRNAVNPATAGKLVHAFSEFNENDDFKVAVLTGTDGTFCAGFDLKELARLKSDDIQNLKESKMNDTFAPMGPSRMTFKKPVIAAISGYAVAGGLELALLCDLRVVETDAIMGVFCRRFGVPLIDGGTVRLPRLIGLSRAMDLILTGRAVQAQEAYDIGLANSVVPKGQALEEAIKLAREIARFPQQCLRADRLSAYNSVFDAKSLEDALQFEYYNGLKVVEAESVKGAAVFSSGVGRHGSFEHPLLRKKL